MAMDFKKLVVLCSAGKHSRCVLIGLEKIMSPTTGLMFLG